MNVLMNVTGKNKKKIRRKRRLKVFGINPDNKNSPVKTLPMETWDVNAEEHKILQKYRKWLEKHFNVQIKMPETASIESDIIFVCIEGEDSSRQFVKTFLDEKKKEKLTYNELPSGNSIPLITLSDSESASDSDSESVCELKCEDVNSYKNLTTIKSEPLNDSVCIVYNPTNSSDLENIACNRPCKGKKRKAKNMKVRSQEVSSLGASELCEVTSTTDDKMVSKKAKLSNSIQIIEELSSSCKPAVEFIPLMSEDKSANQKNEPANTDDSVVVIDDHQPSVVPRRLRPIVIDGSNIAMEHGRTSHTFSVKGLKLAIDYFLNRGHTQVTAFVPKFRRSSNPKRSVPTTNAELFDELEKKQHVVFTPSRRVNGKNINSYDDRFIVQFASSNGGVMVSNDNFRDLLDENEAFKEAIEKRLLMYCFVGDVFMVPDDPLGRNGPKLDEFLSFPPEDEKKQDVKVVETKH